MIPKLALTLVLAIPGVAAAQDKMADQLRKAIVEEEVNQNLDKAIQAYQSILAQYDEERKSAATALFHMADCYRKQGKKDQAIAAYRRVVQEFADQARLADTSRTYLTQTFGLQKLQYETQMLAGTPAQFQNEELKRQVVAILEQEMALVEKQIQSAEKKVEMGLISRDGPEMTALKREVLELRLRLAAAQQGVIPVIEIKK
jgi:tetratricopeptide (TPR) repeat protein